jgi:hypothetical protein
MRDTGKAGELNCRCSEIAVAHDVIAFEDRPRLVSGQFHGDALGHAAAHHVADRGPAEVVRNTTGTASGDARRFPCLRERTDRFRVLLPARLSATILTNTAGQIAPAFFNWRCSAYCASSSLRRSSVIGHTRPSRFFVVPASSRISPAPISTCRHCSGTISLATRQPVT